MFMEHREIVEHGLHKAEISTWPWVYVISVPHDFDVKHVEHVEHAEQAGQVIRVEHSWR